jgi:hypothetical protein
VYPGETVKVRLEGQSFTKARFHFDPLIEVANDSVIKSDNFIEYKVKIPITINKKSILIYNYNQNTGMSLTVKEYQVARPFDFINIMNKPFHISYHFSQAALFLEGKQM